MNYKLISLQNAYLRILQLCFVFLRMYPKEAQFIDLIRGLGLQYQDFSQHIEHLNDYVKESLAAYDMNSKESIHSSFIRQCITKIDENQAVEVYEIDVRLMLALCAATSRLNHFNDSALTSEYADVCHALPEAAWCYPKFNRPLFFFSFFRKFNKNYNFFTDDEINLFKEWNNARTGGWNDIYSKLLLFYRSLKCK